MVEGQEPSRGRRDSLQCPEIRISPAAATEPVPTVQPSLYNSAVGRHTHSVAYEQSQQRNPLGKYHVVHREGTRPAGVAVMTMATSRLFQSLQPSHPLLPHLPDTLPLLLHH